MLRAMAARRSAFPAERFMTFPPIIYMQGFSNGPPFIPRFIRPSVNFENPWATEPGGDPFPLPYRTGLGRNDAIWPQYALVLTADYDTPNMQVTQWNLSLQKQVGTDWLVSASYLGNADESSMDSRSTSIPPSFWDWAVHAEWRAHNHMLHNRQHQPASPVEPG